MNKIEFDAINEQFHRAFGTPKNKFRLTVILEAVWSGIQWLTTENYRRIVQKFIEDGQRMPTAGQIKTAARKIQPFIPPEKPSSEFCAFCLDTGIVLTPRPDFRYPCDCSTGRNLAREVAFCEAMAKPANQRTPEMILEFKAWKERRQQYLENLKHPQVIKSVPTPEPVVVPAAPEEIDIQNDDAELDETIPF